jgi:hypothetical protein
MSLISRFKDFIKPNKFSEPIGESEVFELSELFLEFCDEFDLQLDYREFNSGFYALTNMWLGEDSDLSNNLIYGIQSSRTDIVRHPDGDFDYAFFCFIINYKDSRIGDMESSMKVIYNRIISMGYRCRLESYSSGNSILYLYKVVRDYRLKNTINLPWS